MYPIPEIIRRLSALEGEVSGRGSGGASVVNEPYSVVVRPGGVAKGNVFTSWAAMYASVTALLQPGVPVRVLLDDSLGAISIPAGTYNVNNWSLVGTSDAATQVSVATFQTGAALTVTTGFLFLHFVELVAGGTTPVITAAGVTQVIGDFATVFGGAGAPFFLVPSAQILVLEWAGGELGDGTHAAVTVDVAGTLDASFDFSSMAASAVNGAGAGAGATYFYDASSLVALGNPGTFTMSAVSSAVAYTPAVGGHWPTPAPTEAAAGLDKIAAALANHVETVSGAIAAAAPVSFSSGNFTSTTGKVRWTAGMQVNGVTSVAGEVVLFKLLMDGAVVAAAPQLAVELSATGIDAAISGLTFEVSGVAAGAHTYGIEAVNSTNGAHTLQVFNLGAFVRVEDTF
jgi:hypothetical protein